MSDLRVLHHLFLAVAHFSEQETIRDYFLLEYRPKGSVLNSNLLVCCPKPLHTKSHYVWKVLGKMYMNIQVCPTAHEISVLWDIPLLRRPKTNNWLNNVSTNTKFQDATVKYIISIDLTNSRTTAFLWWPLVQYSTICALFQVNRYFPTQQSESKFVFIY